MDSVLRGELPLLPLVLWDTPPGLEQVLAQEGVSFMKVVQPHPLAFRAGRFVLYDGKRVNLAKVRVNLAPDHRAIDIDALRRLGSADPFEAIVDTTSRPLSWRVGDLCLTECVARYPRARLRAELIGKIRAAVVQAGGVWARLAPFPFPYRSAFNFRADLDEPFPDDYARFARARRHIDDCTTHFVSTHAYGRKLSVLDDLRGLDCQSHGHFHVVYREEAENRRNVDRAHELLVSAGFEPTGFAAPEGRWNAGLDRAIEDRGYAYSSDFGIGYDDLPFYPWREGRFSKVLQVPVHPICEGLFLDAGCSDPAVIGSHLESALHAKIEAGEPAFLYGHPERRLGRFPQVVDRLARAVAGEYLVWRVALTDFAQWWTWRSARRWSIVRRSDGRHEVQFDDWDTSYPLGMEIVRGEHSAVIRINTGRLPLRLEQLAYVRRRVRSDLPEPMPARRRPNLRAMMRTALDWETVTPLEELSDRTFRSRLKRRLRHWRSGVSATRRSGEGGGC